MVVTGRSQGGLPMSRMRMQDELVEIDATALRFDMPESENFLVELSGLDLDRSEVEELTAKTFGWVAALQLASLSLRGCEDPARLIGTLTGRHHAISEFLAENVLDTLEPSMLGFLLTTSITERICGELASALSGVPDGQAMLEQVEERDLFLRRIDEQWFRYYQLFRDSCGTGWGVTSPRGSPSCTASPRRGSPSTGWSVKRWITRWPPVMRSGRCSSLRTMASTWWRTHRWQR